MDKVSFTDILFSLGGFKLKLTKLVDFILGSSLALLLPAADHAKKIPDDIKSALIIRPGGIGDAVFLLPILKLLKQRGVAVDVLCEERNSTIFKSQAQLLGGVYLYHDMKDLKVVFAKRYDVIVDTEQWHFLSGVLCYFMPKCFSVGFGTRVLRRKLFNKVVSYDDGYELDNFARLFQGILPDVTVDTIDNSYQVSPEALAWVKDKIPANMVAVFLGASITARRLSVDESVQLIEKLLAKGFAVALLGGGDVIALSKQVLAHLQQAGVLDFVGKINLMQSAAIISQSKCFIGADSGLLHLAQAVGVKSVGIFGPGNIKKWGPKGGSHQVISKYLPCAPCTRFGYTVPTCQHRYDCMKGIDLELIEKNRYTT